MISPINSIRSHRDLRKLRKQIETALDTKLSRWQYRYIFFGGPYHPVNHYGVCGGQRLANILKCICNLPIYVVMPMNSNSAAYQELKRIAHEDGVPGKIDEFQTDVYRTYMQLFEADVPLTRFIGWNYSAKREDN